VCVYYDREARIVYLPLTPNGDGETLNSQETGWGLIDHNRRGEPCGIEIWNAAQMLPADLLEALPEPPHPKPGSSPK
jgi:uncharacterized protein YuzE